MSNSDTSTGLWTAKDAERATNGAAEGDWIASGVSIDTRAIEPGDLFTAIRGPNDPWGNPKRCKAPVVL